MTIGYSLEGTSTEQDDARRSELRSFLTYHRSRLTPEEVGLPSARRRRVPGLRRQEVAELVGVSEDWYRWFESGRPISVSARFLAKIVEALRLNPQDTLTLYHLALPGLYQASATPLLDVPAALTPNVTPISLPSDIDEAQRRFDAAREAFLRADRADLSVMRCRILGSWRRSQGLSVIPTTRVAPLALRTSDAVEEVREQNRALLSAATPILARLELAFGYSEYCVAVTDRRGYVLMQQGGKRAIALVERVGIRAGADLGERAVGTNGIGTVIADGRPLQITASEHFVEGGEQLTCTGAPIHSADGSICGVVVVMGDYRLVRPGLLPALTRCALEIEEELVESALTTGTLTHSL